MSKLKKLLLALPAAERLHLATFILSSLSPAEVGEEFDIPQAWIDEALEETEKMIRGEVQTLSWDEVKRNVNARKKAEPIL